MANRYQSDDRARRERLRRGRQEEQYQSDRGFNDDPEYGQMGENWRSDYRDQENSWLAGGDSDYYGSERNRDYRRSGNEFDSRSSYGRSRFGNEQPYGRDTSRGSTWDASSGAGSQLAANRGEWRESYGTTPSRERQDYRGTWGRDTRSNERGFLERAGDTLAGWLGDETVERRNDSYRGRGPANYARSDERILEDACDALTEDWNVDASQIQVTVTGGEVTLDGTVPSREQKRRAEDCVDDLSGVKNVQNNLRVQERSTWDRNNSEFTGSDSNPTSTQA